jgi:NADH-quinone oxidoreductase subunit M
MLVGVLLLIASGAGSCACTRSLTRMDLFQGHLLSVITYTPLVGALVLLLPPFRRNDDAVRWVANAFGLLGFLVSLPLWYAFDRQAPGFQFSEKADWIPSIGVQYFFGVDGISRC